MKDERRFDMCGAAARVQQTRSHTRLRQYQTDVNRQVVPLSDA